MISGQLNSSTATKAGRGRHPLRLQMKPDTAARGHVDGGWWPWSDDPVAEFPALVSALEVRVGPVSRVSYNLGVWGPAPRKLVVDGRILRCEGFRSMEANTVVVVGSDSRRVSLLVVPPETIGGRARAALRAAAGSDAIAAVADILSSNGIALGAGVVVPRPRMAEQAPEERWEAEGGHVLAAR
jgi:hypothetical protein